MHVSDLSGWGDKLIFSQILLRGLFVDIGKNLKLGLILRLFFRKSFRSACRKLREKRTPSSVCAPMLLPTHLSIYIFFLSTISRNVCTQKTNHGVTYLYISKIASLKKIQPLL